jgi:hypothetical protein
MKYKKEFENTNVYVDKTKCFFVANEENKEILFTDASTVIGSTIIDKWVWNFGDSSPIDTLITNATSLCGLLTHLNVTNDPKLEEARRQLEQTMLGADIDAIKESPEVRASMKSKVDAILSKFEW